MTSVLVVIVIGPEIFVVCTHNSTAMIQGVCVPLRAAHNFIVEVVARRLWAQGALRDPMRNNGEVNNVVKNVTTVLKNVYSHWQMSHSRTTNVKSDYTMS